MSATVRNPSSYDLFCPPLDRVLAPGERAKITAEQAASMPRSIFVVESTPEPVQPTPEPVQPKRTAKHTPQKETR